MRFVVLVEGYLEQRVLPSFLRGWLDSGTAKRVGIDVIRFQGVNKFTKKLPVAARKHLEGPAQSDLIAAIGMLDLYGVDYYPPSICSVQERYDWLCQHLEEKVGHERFHMFCAVHELEAWVLSQPESLPPAVKNALPGKVQNPESVNFDEPPSKLLQRLYSEKLKRGYKKLVDGTNLFSKLDPAVVRDKCPHLRKMTDKMLRLAHEAGC